MKLGKTLFAIIGATVLLAALTGVAWAGSLSTSGQQLTATFASAEFTGGFGTTRCAVTMEGSFHQSTVVKVAGTLTGYISRETLGACAAGTAVLLAETLPWHVQYSSFNGTLPNISAISANIIGVAFRVRETGGVTCLARSSAIEPATMRFNREVSGVISSATMGGRIRTGAECFGTAGELRGTSNSLTAIRVTLI